ncbi:hypothetical protein DPMN_088510 [Dreissena polymorpha]|uniref:Uncharacterized protein n=1 Tax=Dreissena polymorpha TaxID=45954 RepID=A0A9D4QWG4_DREPO|nr:hypothetical protein DPMN_088510 [Dreissena polymorpha]
MYEYNGEIGGKMVNGQDGGLSPMIADGRDELGRSCMCIIGLCCPSGWRKAGRCRKSCHWWKCYARINCCRR